MAEIFNLDEIFKENNMVLLDTSGFYPHQDFFQDEKNFELIQKKERLLTKISYLKKLKKLLLLNNFYITKEVEKEILNGINYKEYKKVFKEKSKNQKKNLLSPELIKRQGKNLTQILNKLYENNHIIDPKIKSSKEYICNYKKYQSLINFNKLSDPDYDLLITGLILSLTKKKVGVVTLDNGILNAYKEIIKKENKENNTFFSAYSPNTKSYGLVI